MSNNPTTPAWKEGLPERPGMLKAMVTGKRTQTVSYGIKAASEYTYNAEAYMNALGSRLEDVYAQLAYYKEWIAL